MWYVFRKYGSTIEITEIEKEPSKVRVSHPRKRRTVYGARRSDNIRRAQKICLRRVSAAIEDFGSPLLVTLTFTGDASDAAYANDTLRRFQVRLRSKYPHAESVFAPELSPHGRIHIHGLLFNVPLSLGDTRDGRRIISHGDERKERILAKLWGEGYVDATKTDGSIGLAYYLAKYITKEGDQVIFNAMHLIRISRGIPHEIAIRGWLAEELARRYAERKPTYEWEDERPFLGKIKKKWYQQPPQ
jgi:hypothetical protein